MQAAIVIMSKSWHVVCSNGRGIANLRINALDAPQVLWRQTEVLQPGFSSCSDAAWTLME